MSKWFPKPTPNPPIYNPKPSKWSVFIDRNSEVPRAFYEVILQTIFHISQEQTLDLLTISDKSGVINVDGLWREIAETKLYEINALAYESGYDLQFGLRPYLDS